MFGYNYFSRTKAKSGKPGIWLGGRGIRKKTRIPGRRVVREKKMRQHIRSSESRWFSWARGGDDQALWMATVFMGQGDSRCSEYPGRTGIKSREAVVV